jgi:oligopeptide transport system substrate-binding protein
MYLKPSTFIESWLKVNRRTYVKLKLLDENIFEKAAKIHNLVTVRYLLNAVLILGLVSLLAGCSRAPNYLDGLSTLRISQRNEPSDLDPATTSLPDDYFIIRALSEGLLITSPQTGAPSAGIAISWNHSLDAKVWTFHLRKDAKWSNGDSVTAYDFIDSYRRVLSTNLAAPKAELLFLVKNAKAYYSGIISDFSRVGFYAPDDHTLVISLENPTPDFLMYVVSGIWVPVHTPTVKKWGKNWTKPEHYVGNGAYTLKTWIPNQKITVEKNLLYHDQDKVHISSIEFIRYDNAESEERSFRSGGVDITMAIPINKIAVYAKEHPSELHKCILAETRYISFNTNKYPLNDARVREAIYLALDRSTLVLNVLKGGQQPIDKLIPDTIWKTSDNTSYTPTEHIDQELNLNRAKVLLKEAGFPEGKNFPALELSSWTNPTLLEAIQATLKRDLGISITINIQEARVHLAALQSGNYSLGLMTLIPDVADPLEILENFSSQSPNNYPHFKDAEFDQLLNDAKNAADKNSRLNILKKAELRLIFLAPIAPLYLNSQNWLMSDHITGWYADPLWRRSYIDLKIKP